MLHHTLLIVCVACTSALANVHQTAPGPFRWHPSLGDSMVLQRSPGRAAVFGFGAPPNANCEAQLNGGWQGYKTAAADGSWRLELGVQGASTQGSVLTVSCAGAPYNLTARDVVFGDVYITSGQSNMELPVEHTFSYWNVSLNGTKYFEQPNIRVTKVPHNLQLQPATTLGAPLIWSRANWSALKGHSAISYYFAKELSTMLEGGGRSSHRHHRVELGRHDHRVLALVRGAAGLWVPHLWTGRTEAQGVQRLSDGLAPAAWVSLQR
eukprot:COSAG01_NODE_5539_length_4199_cov_2.221220_3_plen_266_part_00